RVLWVHSHFHSVHVLGNSVSLPATLSTIPPRHHSQQQRRQTATKKKIIRKEKDQSIKRLRRNPARLKRNPVSGGKAPCNQKSCNLSILFFCFGVGNYSLKA